jgi:signal transduction histidine kinase
VGRFSPWFRSAHVRFLLLIVLIELCLVVAMLGAVARQLHNAIDARDESVASQLRDDLIDQASASTPDEFENSLASRLDGMQERGDLIALVDGMGRVTVGNIRGIPAGLRADGSAHWLLVRAAGASTQRRYFISVTGIYGDSRLLVGHASERSEALRGAITEAALKSLFAALPLALLGAWLAIRVIEGRVERISATAAAVAEGNLSERVALDGSRDSFDKLGARVNDMLDRIGGLVEELRVLSDSLAHDLRSPIMRLRARIDTALSNPHSEAEWPEVLGAIGLEADRLQAMLSNALEISRAEAGLPRRQMAEQDLAVLIADIADLYEPLVEESGRALEVVVAEPCRALVHREMLTLAISNLIDNALKYGAGAIILSVGRTTEGEASLCVADHGPGIPQDQEQVAVSRFGRLDNARSESGAGLGLALVESTVRMHGGTLHFRRSDRRFSICAVMPGV